MKICNNLVKLTIIIFQCEVAIFCLILYIILIVYLIIRVYYLAILISRWHSIFEISDADETIGYFITALYLQSITSLSLNTRRWTHVASRSGSISVTLHTVARGCYTRCRRALSKLHEGSFDRYQCTRVQQPFREGTPTHQ